MEHNFEIAVIGLMIAFGGSTTALLAIIANLLWRRMDGLEKKIDGIQKQLNVMRGEA